VSTLANFAPSRIVSCGLSPLDAGAAISLRELDLLFWHWNRLLYQGRLL
jgi:hypothetical protein